MTYQFAGIFIKEFQIPGKIYLDIPHTVKKINSPFIGFGISIPEYMSKNPSIEEINEIANKIGIKQDLEWMFIIYECWAGEIDDFFGYIKKPDKKIISIIEFSRDKLEDAYSSFMEEFGISKDDALNFEPFKRGFWGEQ